MVSPISAAALGLLCGAGMMLRALSVLIVSAGVVAAPAVAHALSCARYEECTSGFLLDSSGMPIRAPLNVELRFAPRDAARALPPIDGGNVSLDCRDLEGLEDGVRACKIVGAEPNTEYAIEGVTAPIVTSSSSDTAAPALPLEFSARWYVADGNENAMTTPARGLNVFVRTAERASTLTLELGVRHPDGTERVYATAGNSIGTTDVINAFLGKQVCHCRPDLEPAELPPEVDLRVRLIDAAGNAGPWTAYLTPSDRQVLDDDPFAEGCTCVALPATGASFAALAIFGGLALVIVRRRSPSR